MLKRSSFFYPSKKILNKIIVLSVILFQLRAIKISKMKKYFIAFAFLFALTFILSVHSCKFAPKKVALDVAAKPFELLSQYNFFTGALNSLTPNERILPYDLISPLFTDYAHKARFVYVPEGKQVAYDDKEVLNLPVGSCYIKNFYYPADFSKPKEKWRIIETRLLVHRKDGWEALDYIWNDDQSDAKLEVAGDIKKVSWIHYDGSKKEVDYVIPNKNQCKGCHWENNVGIMPIGPKVRNLNKSIAFADGEKNQLAKWIEAGFLKDAPNLSQMPKMVDYNDESAELNDRARAYLDINCGHCHRDKGPAYTSGLWLNLDNENMENLGICKSPVAAGKGTGGLLVDIFPGHPELSILPLRMKSEDAGIKMPEVGKVLVHTEGVALIEKWITAMQGECK